MMNAPLLLSNGLKKKPFLGMQYTGVTQAGDQMMQGLAESAPDKPKYVQLEEDIQTLEKPTETESEKTGLSQEELDAMLKMVMGGMGGNSLPTGPFSTGPSLARQRAMAGFGRSFGR